MKFKCKKKKGSTIVEIIAAVAILLLGLNAVTISFSTSSKLWQNHNKKLDTNTLNQTICQNFRQWDRMNIRTLYDDNVTGSPPAVNLYIYFNDYDELINAIGDDTSYFFTPTTKKEDIFVECKAGKPMDKKYGALISIIDDKDSGDYYALYRFDVFVWNLEDVGNYEAHSYFYIGG